VTKKSHKQPKAPVEFELGSAEPIELGSLLKFVGLVGTGGEAKHRVQSGEVRVNGQVETRRGRKLVAGDRVEARGRLVLLVAPPAPAGGAPAPTGG